MKHTLILAITALTVLSAGSASANFKVAEFTYGVKDSLKNTVVKSIRQTKPVAPTRQQVITPGLSESELNGLYETFGKR